VPVHYSFSAIFAFHSHRFKIEEQIFSLDGKRIAGPRKNLVPSDFNVQL